MARSDRGDRQARLNQSPGLAGKQGLNILLGGSEAFLSASMTTPEPEI
jgi:hypothetical protein